MLVAGERSDVRMRARIFERQPFFGGLDFALGGAHVGPFGERDVEKALDGGTNERQIQLDGHIPAGNGIVLDIFGETYHGLPEMKVRLAEGGIEFESLEPYLDDVR